MRAMKFFPFCDYESFVSWVPIFVELQTMPLETITLLELLADKKLRALRFGNPLVDKHLHRGRLLLGEQLHVKPDLSNWEFFQILEECCAIKEISTTEIHYTVSPFSELPNSVEVVSSIHALMQSLSHITEPSLLILTSDPYSSIHLELVRAQLQSIIGKLKSSGTSVISNIYAIEPIADHRIRLWPECIAQNQLL